MARLDEDRVDEARPLLSRNRAAISSPSGVRGSQMASQVAGGFLVGLSLVLRVATSVFIKMAFDNDSDTNLTGLILISNVVMLSLLTASYSCTESGLGGIAEIWSDDYGLQRVKLYCVNGVLGALSFMCTLSSLGDSTLRPLAALIDRSAGRRVSVREHEHRWFSAANTRHHDPPIHIAQAQG